MVGPFGGQRGTSLRSTEPQVTGPIDDREMGCCEAVCGAAAGKSLAHIPVGCPVVAGLRDARVRGSGNCSKPVELLERVIGPEVGFEPTTFRLRGDRKSESPSRLGKVAQVRQGAWQARASLPKAEHRPSHRPGRRRPPRRPADPVRIAARSPLACIRSPPPAAPASPVRIHGA
jgi:hypothetical protein